MFSISGWKMGAGRMAALGALVAIAGGCDGVLDIEDPEDVRAEELAGPASVPTVINGFVGNFLVANEDYILYSGMFTDEFILAGTFPTRLVVDQRVVRQDPDNSTITGALYEPIQTTQRQAEQAIEDFEAALGDEEFASVEGEMRDGIAFGTYYRAKALQYLAELYCQSVVDTVNAPLGPDARMEQALAMFEETETLADERGLDDFANASRVGQGRALLWLERYDEAATAVEEVPRGFQFFAEHSQNDPEQFNQVYQFTWGDLETIRWTVGDGGETDSRGEEFAYFEQFVEFDLIEQDAPGFSAFNTSIAVNLQQKYDKAESFIKVASGAEARLTEAEVAIRDGRTGDAEAILNDLRSDWVTRFTLTPTRSALVIDDLEDISLSGDLEEDLQTYAAERERELWLEGDRQFISRRFIENDGIDLYPDRTGEDICFPIPQQELDNNPLFN